MPRSAPDARLLQDVPSSGLPIRLRVFIDAEGMVTRVHTLAAADEDQAAAERLALMLSRTAFIPAQVGGRDVASYTDLEMRISDLR